MDWSWARYSEILLFGEGPLPPRYVWEQIGACTFTTLVPPRRKLVVYPQIKIYETGVVLVHFRMFSPERPLGVKEYINQFVNASLREFRWVTVPPGVAAWAPMAVPEANIFRWYRRPWTAFAQWHHQRFLAEHVELAEIGDFSFRQVSLGLAQDHALAERVVVLKAQSDLADFDWAVQDTGQFGEVRDQIEAGWAAFGVPKLRQRITERSTRPSRSRYLPSRGRDRQMVHIHCAGGGSSRRPATC